MTAKPKHLSSQDVNEISNFSNFSSHWWDHEGPFSILHEINPLRIKYIVDICKKHFGRDLSKKNAFDGLSLLDVGTGGGLVAEPISKVGFKVTGIDASRTNIDVATKHSELKKLKISYICGSPEENQFDKMYFDVILALEVIEHVSNIELFVKSLSKKLNPGGLIIFSSINRSYKSLFFAKFVAEYVFKWVPKGTHDWEKFVKPSELSKILRLNNLNVISNKGLNFNPLSREWSLSEDITINYFITATNDL